MSINIHTLYDVIIAIVTTVGIAAALSIALTVAGAFFERSKAREAQPVRAAVPSQHPTQSDDARELVLR
jgi:Kef-type K+ transport system membrane component KefB